MGEIMREVYKDGAISEDRWQRPEAEAAVDPAVHSLIPLQRFLLEREALAEPLETGHLGVILGAGDDPLALQDVLTLLPIVALDFPSFADGRSFSSAHILRETLGFKGELRAVGPFILDQIGFMQRCGIDSFALDNPRLKPALVAGNLNEVTVYTQPVTTRAEEAPSNRPWLRQAQV
ncbi:DUF934 domain-containing protein [Polycladidibacter hongkongensis]|uniref:DUF934 domain-containing protein n=1 Tax=Polycladidibacter hongkongensis TaxID=1647556 RepID=UPI000AE2E331|nr:DUF934 domain-containing protein [Pseudovibrio hongkongensis]